MTVDREPEVRTVLVPVDGSDAATEAVDHAAAIAERYGAGVHALYVLDTDEAGEIRGDDVGNERLAGDTQRYLDGVRRTCDRAGVGVTCSTAMGFSTGRLTRHPGSVVLDCAEEVGADFLVVPRENATEEPGILSEAAEYVLSYASQPVLSV